MKVYKPGQRIPDEEKFAYITAKEGHYLLKRNGFFDACVRINDIPGLPEQEEFFNLKTGKIPLVLFRRALSFLRKVYEEHRTEGIVLLTHDKNEWGVYIPEQEVKPASLSYTNDEKRRVVGSIHSHPGFSSHPSGTDEHDELGFDGIHLVTSSFQLLPESLTAFAVVNGRRFRIRVEDLIEGIEQPSDAFPEEWMSKVKTRHPKPKRERKGRDGDLWPEDRGEPDEDSPIPPWWEREDALPI